MAGSTTSIRNIFNIKILVEEGLNIKNVNNNLNVIILNDNHNIKTTNLLFL